MNTFVKKSFLLSAAAVAALVALSPGTARAHEAQPRSEDFRVENEVYISSHQIQVYQTQVYSKEFLNKLWNRMDADKDGKFSKEEAEGLVDNLRNNYTDHNALRINWTNVAPSALMANASGVTSRRPKNVDKAKPVKVLFCAVYDFTPSDTDLVELVIPALNAHEVKCWFILEDKSLKAKRANVGDIKKEGSFVESMLQIDGHPDTFSVLLAKEKN